MLLTCKFQLMCRIFLTIHKETNLIIWNLLNNHMQKYFRIEITSVDWPSIFCSDSSARRDSDADNAYDTCVSYTQRQLLSLYKICYHSNQRIKFHFDISAHEILISLIICYQKYICLQFPFSVMWKILISIFNVNLCINFPKCNQTNKTKKLKEKWKFTEM